MPPRLAYHRLFPEPSSLSRTIWDEVCSIYLCFISPLIKEDAVQARDTAGLGFRLLDRMIKLYVGETFMLLPQYQSNSTVVAAFKNAVVKLFPNHVWSLPPDDAVSELWWDRLRGILDEFVAS
jgi:hypothetical protein